MVDTAVSSDCVFCDIAAGRVDADLVAYRDAAVFVVPTLTQREANPGQVIILPLGHVTGLHRADPALLAHVFRVTAAVTAVAATAFGAVGTTVLQSTDAPDQPLNHLHVHVIPRYPDDGLTIPNPHRVPAPREQRSDIAERLRGHLAGLDARG
jgi:diadenosine tetraphosphate (Ap4A) HIT family hydrolase